MGDVEAKVTVVELNEKEIDLIKKTIFELEEHTYKKLEAFMLIEGIEPHIKPEIFMHNVVNNYLFNVFFQSNNGKIEEMREDGKCFIGRLIIFFDKIITILVKSKSKYKNEVH